MTPADEMRAAAKLLREKAAAATPGPWEIEYAYQSDRPQAVFRMDPAEPDDLDMALGVGIMDEPADNAWVALLGPDKAEPLACWLDVAARMTNIGCRMAGRESLSVEQRAARDLVRSILGIPQ